MGRFASSKLHSGRLATGSQRVKYRKQRTRGAGDIHGTKVALSRSDFESKFPGETLNFRVEATFSFPTSDNLPRLRLILGEHNDECCTVSTSGVRCPNYGFRFWRGVMGGTEA